MSTLPKHHILPLVDSTLEQRGTAPLKPSPTSPETRETGRKMILKSTSNTSRRRTDWILSLAFSGMLTLTGFPAAAPVGAAGRVEVKIDNFSFSPTTLTVKAGTQITWTNGDDIPHTAVSNDHNFKSKVLG